MVEPLEQLLVYCRENDRVCPMPQQWNRLWDMLPEKSRRGLGWEPSLPLILAAWWEASDQQKQDRLKSHLRWASEHGVLDQVAEFLRSLPEREWHHRGDILEGDATKPACEGSYVELDWEGAWDDLNRPKEIVCPVCGLTLAPEYEQYEIESKRGMFFIGMPIHHPGEAP